MRTINLLIKPVSSLCNLRCKYCFYEDEAQNRSQRSMGMMKEAVAEELIYKAYEAASPSGFVSFAFQGGEPTLAGLPFFQHFVQLAKERKPARTVISFSIQTNGILLNEDWADFFYNEKFLVGLSLDGCLEVHDNHRVNELGKGTWNQVTAAKKLLEKYNVEYNALCVVTKRCARSPEKIYSSLKRLGFRYIQFIACLDPINAKRGQMPWSLSPKAYGNFLCRIFDLWYKDWVTGNYHSIRLFEDYVHILLADTASTCAACGKCGSYFVVEGDGSVYPCDFYALDHWCLGNITSMTFQELEESERTKKFMSLGDTKPAECASCPYGYICNGGCKNDWITDSTGLHNYYCSSFQQLFNYALPRMKQVAQAEKMARLTFML